MTNVIGKLVVLVAVLLMPFGMSPAPAGALHHVVSADLPMGHCPDQGSGHHGKAGIDECTMACAAALPAADSRNDAPLCIAGETAVAATAPLLHGLHPETATPPPKRS